MKRSEFGYLLVLVSGPARAGKNRAATCLSDRLGGDHFALSNLLKRMTHVHYGMGEDLPPLHFEDTKDQAAPEFDGLSPRQAYIRYSEEIMKPQRGNGYLGLIAAQRVEKNRSKGMISIVSGVGFEDEVLPMIKAAGAWNTLHISIRPAGGSGGRAIDSRNPLFLERLGVDTVELRNLNCEQFIEDLEQSLVELSSAAKDSA